MFEKGDFKVGDKVKVTVKSLYKEGTIIGWSEHYSAWEIVITSRFCRGEMMCFDSSMLKKR